MAKLSGATCKILLAFLCLSLPACAARPNNVTTVYSLEGPPLAIAAEQGTLLFEGSMERLTMLGEGRMEFRRVEKLGAESPKNAKAAPEGGAESDRGGLSRSNGPVASPPPDNAQARAVVSDFSQSETESSDLVQNEPAARYNPDIDSPQVCAGPIRGRMNQQGHLAAALLCDNQDLLMLTYRALGPDQGIGIGRFVRPNEDRAVGEPLIFYFHPWREEARRRLDQEKSALRDIISKGQTE